MEDIVRADPIPMHKRSILPVSGEALIAPCLAFLALIPFFIARFPPLVDYPSHLARFAVMLKDGSVWPGSAYYEIDWAIVGNLGTELIALPLGRLVGVEAAGWLIAASIPALTIVSIFSVSKALGRPHGFGAYLALPFAFPIVLQLGFLNYCLSVCLAMFAFAAWLSGRWPRLVFVPISVLLWLCHAAGWGVFCLMVGGFELTQSKHPRILAVRLWPATVPALFLPWMNKVASSANSGDWLTYKAKGWFKVLAASSWQFDLFALFVIIFALYFVLRSRRGSIDWRAGLPALILGAATIIMPRGFGGGDLADVRMAMPALIMLCLSINWIAPPIANFLIVASFLVRLTGISLSWHSGSRDVERALQALDRIEPGARILNLVAYDGTQWHEDRYLQLASYAVVRKGALVNSNFAIPGVHLLKIKPDPAFIDPSQVMHVTKDKKLDLRQLEFPCCDYVWIMSSTPRGVILPVTVRTIYQDEHSILAGRIKAK